MKRFVAKICSFFLQLAWPLAVLIGASRIRTLLLLYYRYRSTNSQKLKKPFVFIAAPKSASKTILLRISKSLENGIQLVGVKTPNGPWPLNTKLNRGELLFSLLIGNIAHEHLCADERTLKSLALITDELYVHVRDPRQIVVSMTDHFVANRERLLQFGVDQQRFNTYSPIANYDYMIDEFFPAILNWMDDWYECWRDRKYGIKINFTHFEQFRADEQEFISGILQFISMENDYGSIDGLSKHYRKGTTDEWKDVFTSDQLKRMGAMMDVEKAVFFGWSTDYLKIDPK